MDKASIIADAVAYVKNLQSHASKLKEDVATLEARPGLAGRRQQQQQQQKQGRRQGQHGRNGGDDEGNSGSSRGGGGARVTLVSAAQVGEGRFFVTVECERRDGVAAPLCAAVESLAGFLVESSNLGCSSDRVVSTLTLKVLLNYSRNNHMEYVCTCRGIFSRLIPLEIVVLCLCMEFQSSKITIVLMWYHRACVCAG